MRYQLFAFTPDMTGTQIGQYETKYDATNAMSEEYDRLITTEGFKPLRYKHLLVFDQDDQDIVETRDFPVTFLTAEQATAQFDDYIDKEYPPVEVNGYLLCISDALKNTIYRHYMQLRADWLNDNQIVVTS